MLLDPGLAIFVVGKKYYNVSCNSLFIINTFNPLPLGTVRPVYRTGVSLLSRERFFIYLINKYISVSDICLTVHH